MIEMNELVENIIMWINVFANVIGKSTEEHENDIDAFMNFEF